MDEPTDIDEVAIEALIEETYAAMSNGDPGTSRFFAHPDIAIAGSGQGELVVGPDMAARMAAAVTDLGYRWTPDEVLIWVRGDFAWARSSATSRSGRTRPPRMSRTGRRASSGAMPTDGRGVTGAGRSHRRSHGFR